MTLTGRVHVQFVAIHNINVNITRENALIGGLVAQGFEGLNPTNTILSFCSGESGFSKLNAGENSTKIATKPVVVGVSFAKDKEPQCSSQRDQIFQDLEQLFQETVFDSSCEQVIASTRTRPPSSSLSLTRTQSSSMSSTHSLPKTRSMSRVATPSTLQSRSLSLTRSISLQPPRQDASSNETEVNPTVETQRKTVTFTTSATLVTSAANSAGPGLQDMQALVVLGSMSCASDEVQTVSGGGEKSVVPFEVSVLEEGSASRTMISNAILLGTVFVIHGMVAIALAKRKQKPFIEACGLARFPAWSFTAFVLLYQGTILTAFRAVFSPHPPPPTAS